MLELGKSEKQQGHLSDLSHSRDSLAFLTFILLSLSGSVPGVTFLAPVLFRRAELFIF